MGKKGKAAIWVPIFSIICGLIIWHVVHWHSIGMYLEMFKWIGTGKGYITVLYNVGLMLVLGGALGFLMEKVTDLLGYEIHEIKHFEDRSKADKPQ